MRLRTYRIGKNYIVGDFVTIRRVRTRLFSSTYYLSDSDGYILGAGEWLPDLLDLGREYYDDPEVVYNGIEIYIGRIIKVEYKDGMYILSEKGKEFALFDNQVKAEQEAKGKF